MLLFWNQEGRQTRDWVEKSDNRRTLGTVAMYMSEGANVTSDGVGHLGWTE
jgi:hypothetical protein